ncbi:MULTISPECIES: hypothetical protein [unclassified Streptomyces]|uniref:hypothetical protein n=1 Tax=unclassified Streptomyces TaxID=2593676 RepID=UPI001BEC67C6|nr:MULTISPECIES: hypothetical protein [unclassified Streptomyces]MBT2406867.1 hypothetical protein [Streptomyces sp. ISL-21]MBT2612956.1 hypothetical protein [Streptomyces sp. ISL-87]
MTTISVGDIDRVTNEARAYHHPHFTGASPNSFNRLVFSFRPFTGAEEEPERPLYTWKDESLTEASRAFIDAEYDEAIRLWRMAAYTAALKQAATGAEDLWGAYSRARTAMDERFASLDSAPDAHWRATVSQLVAAQNRALETATVWDRKGLEIATVHEKFVYADLYPEGAYKAISVDPRGWVLGSAYDYESFRGGPLAREVQQRIDAQREHLRTVAALSGDRDPA